MKKYLLGAAICFAAFGSCKNGKGEKQASLKAKDSADVAAGLFSKPKLDIKTVGVLLYDGYSTLDAMGPYNVLGEMMGTNVFFVGRHKGLVADIRGMQVKVDTSIADVKHLDILVVPGGFRETYEATKDTALLQWIKAIDSSSVYTTSVCTGAWILGAAGLLKNREATTHWYGKKILAQDFGANVQGKRYVRSGKYWTSAGITAGIDMSLALINEIRGANYTKSAMLDLEYDPQPPVKGGSEYNTDTAIVNGMRANYDMAMQNVLHPLAAYQNIHFDNSKDLYCGMPLKPGAIGDTTHYHGKVYGFCSKACKNEFLTNPAAYVATK